MQETNRRTQGRRGGPRYTRFVFTLNNYTDAEEMSIKTITNVKWLIFGKEIGENGTPHLQGACVIGKQLALSTIKRFPGLSRAHIEKMMGTPQQSLLYCSKEDVAPYQYGSLPEPGKRKDLEDVVELLTSGQSIREIVNSQNLAAISCVVKYPRGLSYVSSLLTGSPREPPIVIWISGSTGIGKTRSAVEFAESICGEDYWMSNGSLRWFDGYERQQVAIFDDLRTKHVEFSMLLRLLDRYKLRVEFKGGYVDWVPRYIIITAPVGPRLMWNLRRDEDLEQLGRRVTHEFECQSYAELSGELTKLIPDKVRDTEAGSASSQEDNVQSDIGRANVESCSTTEEFEDQDALHSSELSLDSWLRQHPEHRTAIESVVEGDQSDDK